MYSERDNKILAKRNPNANLSMPVKNKQARLLSPQPMTYHDEQIQKFWNKLASRIRDFRVSGMLLSYFINVMFIFELCFKFVRTFLFKACFRNSSTSLFSLLLQFWIIRFTHIILSIIKKFLSVHQNRYFKCL